MQRLGQAAARAWAHRPTSAVLKAPMSPPGVMLPPNIWYKRSSSAGSSSCSAEVSSRESSSSSTGGAPAPSHSAPDLQRGMAAGPSGAAQGAPAPPAQPLQQACLPALLSSHRPYLLRIAKGAGTSTPYPLGCAASSPACREPPACAQAALACAASASSRSMMLLCTRVANASRQDSSTHACWSYCFTLQGRQRRMHQVREHACKAGRHCANAVGKHKSAWDDCRTSQDYVTATSPCKKGGQAQLQDGLQDGKPSLQLALVQARR